MTHAILDGVDLVLDDLDRVCDRLLGALDQQEFAIFEDQRADTQEGARGIAPAFFVNTARSPSHSSAHDTPKPER